MKIFIYYIVFAALFMSLSYAIDITTCTNLSSAGTTYNMLNNVNVSSGTCMNITSASVTLDCHGFYINTSNGYQIGGNFYANTTGGGYSEICADVNHNGFCDDALNLNTGLSCTAGVNCSNNTDYYPLSNKYKENGNGYIIIVLFLIVSFFILIQKKQGKKNE